MQRAGEQVIAKAKENGLSFLEGYESVLKNMLDLEEQAARRSGAEWATTMVSTHVNFVRETSEVFLRRHARAAEELTPRTPAPLP